MAKKTNSEWPKIRQRGQSFQVDCGRVFGNRRRKNFASREEAESYAVECRRERDELKAARKQERRNRSVSLQNLTDTQRAEVIQAYDILGRDTGLVDAVRFYAEHHGANHGDITLEDLFDRYMEAKSKKNLRPRSLRNIKNRLESFVWDNKDRLACSVTQYDLESYLDAKGGTWSTRETYRLAFSGMFNWGMKQRPPLVDANPAAEIEQQQKDESDPYIHTPAEVRRMLKTAAKKRPAMIPYFAIAYFAGLRPENELRNLDWSNIDLESRSIYVDPRTAKKRRSRYVAISDNLAAWLAEYPQPAGKVYFSRRYFRSIRKAAGVKWGHDVMRHTFGTYHLMKHENKHLTAKEMGHSDIDVLMDHYQRPVKKNVASKFWNITPKATESNVIDFRTA